MKHTWKRQDRLDKYNRENDLPYQHYLLFWRMFQHKALPIVEPYPDTRPTVLCVFRSNPTYSPLKGKEYFHRFLPAVFVLWKAIENQHYIRNVLQIPIEKNPDSPEFLCSLKALVFSNWKHAQKSFTTSKIIISDSCIVFLTRRIQNIYLDLLSVEYNLKKKQSK